MDEHGCTVILPTYNEEANIGRMIETLRELYPSFKIVVMDDNSKDSTKKIVESMSSSDSAIRFISRDPNDRGLSASIFQGIEETDTEFFINMDSDFQHPPEYLKDIYESLCDGSDLCIGVRANRTALSSFGRWLASWAAHYIVVFMLKLHNKKVSRDVMSGLFGGKTELFKKVINDNRDDLEMRGFKALVDLMKFGPDDLNITEIEYVFGERAGGESKIGSNVILSVMRQCDWWGNLAAKIAKKIL